MKLVYIRSAQIANFREIRNWFWRFAAHIKPKKEHQNCVNLPNRDKKPN